MKAIILAGGKGTRLKPLTTHLPKPMVPLLNRPCMEYSIKLLKQHGITDIGITVQYLSGAIKEYFGDGSQWGVNIEYFDETIPLGTAGGVKNAEDFLDERFVVISGDALTDFDLSLAIRFHQEKQSIATMIMKEVEDPTQYGVIITDDEGKIIRFQEKPSWSEVFSHTVNTGIYIFEPEIFTYYERNVAFDFAKDLFPLLMKSGQSLYGVSLDGYWSDIGNLEMYRSTQFDMLAGNVKVEIEAEQIAPGIYAESQAIIEKGAHIEAPAYIGSHSVVAGQARIGANSVIGSHNWIQPGVSMQETILWDHNVIGKNAVLSASTLNHHCRIGEEAMIDRGAVLGNECRVEPRSHVQTGLKLEPHSKPEWKDSAAAAF